MKEQALDMLERVFGKGWGKKDWIEKDPDYDPLREDPRFKAMMEKLGSQTLEIRSFSSAE